MFGPIFTSAALTVSAIAALAANAAHADDDQSIDTLTVTAHRIKTSAVPKLDRIEQQAIERRGRYNGPDVLEVLPGFAVSRNGAFGSQAQVRVRGSEANHLQVLVDGIEMNDPAIGSEYDFAHLNLVGVQTIEFLPGAQSALFGSDAVAGVLNLRTVPNERTRRVEVGGGSFDTWQARAHLADRLAQGHYSLALSSYDTEGTNTATTGDEKDGYENRHAHFNGGFNRGVWRSNLVLRYTDTEAEFDPAPFPISVPVDGDERFDHEEFAAKVEIGADLLDGRWQPQLSVSYLDTDNETRTDGRIVNTTGGKRLRFALQHHFRLSERHAVTGILEHEEEEFAQTGAPSFFGNPNQTQDIAAQSVALEHIGRFGDLSTAISARYDDNDDFDAAISYRVAARYRLNQRAEVYAAAGTSIKNPTFYERFGFTPDTFVGNPDLDPEENRHLSAGVAWTGTRWSASATYFNDKLRDEIDGFVFDPGSGGFTAQNIDDDSKREGVELQATARLGSVDLSGGYTYLDAQDRDGVDELRRPRHSGHLQLGRGFAGDRGYLQVGGVFVGEQIDTDFRSFTPVALDAYSRVHLTLDYELTRNLRIGGRLENALDEETEDLFMFRAPGRAAFLTLAAEI